MEEGAFVECWKITVHGAVQGVYYRQAVIDGVNNVIPKLTGHIQNMDDGTVEILGIGTPEDLKKLQTCCHTGSSISKVSKMDVEKLTEIPVGYDKFYIKDK